MNTIPKNSCFMTTTCDFKKGEKGSEKTPEIRIDGDAVLDFSEKMCKKGFLVNTIRDVDAGKLSQYFKAMSGILPNGCKFEPELDPDHKYRMFNKGGNLIQVIDKTDDTQVMSISPHSIFGK